MTKRIIITFKGWGADTLFRYEVDEDNFSEKKLNWIIKGIQNDIREQADKLRMLEELKK